MSRMPAPAERLPKAVPMARRLVAARLISLMKLLYRSAGPAYRSETRLPDLEWRVMMQAGDRGPVVLSALATLLHQDKGQVSRAVKGLVSARLLSREHLRAPITLTKTGQAMFDRIVKLGRSRNAELIRELTEKERRALPRLLMRLQGNARSLLTREKPSRTAAGGTLPGTQHRLVAQEMFALQNLLQRSAALTFRRATRLLDFEWRVLSQVGEHAPLTLIQLVPLLSRDKSQVGRTLARLEVRGLITREKIGGGRHVLVDVSERGRQVYEQLAELALARNEALVTGLSTRDQQTLLTVFDKLTTAATLLAAHGRAR